MRSPHPCPNIYLFWTRAGAFLWLLVNYSIGSIGGEKNMKCTRDSHNFCVADICRSLGSPTNLPVGARIVRFDSLPLCINPELCEQFVADVEPKNVETVRQKSFGADAGKGGRR